MSPSENRHEADRDALREIEAAEGIKGDNFEAKFLLINRLALYQ